MQEPLTKLSNWTNKIKNRFVPVASDIKVEVNNKSDANVGQNIPAPPADNDKERGNRRFGRAGDVDSKFET